MAHSLIPPSKAEVWGAPGGCTGYVTMAQIYSGGSSVNADEGTAAHELGARMIDSHARANIGFPLLKDVLNTQASNGILFTEEIYESALKYADDVLDVMRSVRVMGGEGFGIEQWVKAERVHPLSAGTVDMNIFVRGPNVLYLWDYKHGYKAVEVFENWQLINYAAGLIDKYCELYGLSDLDIRVIARIAQPRAFHKDGIIREWAFQASDIRGHINILASNAAKALGPNAEVHSGSHCRYCSARHACPAALKAGIGFYEMAMNPIPDELSPEAIALQYSIIKRAREQLEFLESGYEAQLYGLITKGSNVLGYSLEETFGRETWSKPIEEVISLGDMLGVNLRNPQAKTPNQARQAGLSPELISAYSYKPKNGLKLVQNSNLNGRKIFS